MLRNMEQRSCVFSKMEQRCTDLEARCKFWNNYESASLQYVETFRDQRNLTTFQLVICFLWRHLKKNIYRIVPWTMEGLNERILNSLRTLKIYRCLQGRIQNFYEKVAKVFKLTFLSKNSNDCLLSCSNYYFRMNVYNSFFSLPIWTFNMILLSIIKP